MTSKDPEIVESFDDIEIYKKSSFINKIGVKAMQEERKKNIKLGIPAAFMQSGKIFYELPDGTITDQKPW